MNEWELEKRLGIVGNNNPLTTTLALILAGTERKKVSKEHIERVKRDLEIQREEEARQNYIRKGNCPSCDGKLIRGKKSKENDYKRSWKCTDCGLNHFI